MKLKGHERQEKGNKLIKNQRRQLTIYVLSKMTVFLLDNCRYPLYFITYSRKECENNHNLTPCNSRKDKDLFNLMILYFVSWLFFLFS